jgi:AcrR family transcriptional regulator
LLERLPIRRQARGERRIEQILHAATRVFAKVGFSRATTNAIAAEAGISVGSLYQFFANKEQIAEALEARYAELLAKTRDAANAAKPGQTLEQRVGALIDVVVAASRDAPGFHALFSERPYSANVARETHAHHEALIAQLDALIAHQAPTLPHADRQRITQVAVQICRGVMPTIVAADGAESDRLVVELKAAVSAYVMARAPAEPSPRSGRPAGR